MNIEDSISEVFGGAGCVGKSVVAVTEKPEHPVVVVEKTAIKIVIIIWSPGPVLHPVYTITECR